MSDEPDPLEGDAAYSVRLVCPNCAARELVELELRPRLEQIPGEARLGLKVKTGKKLHVCGQTAIVSETGEVIRLDLDGRPVMPDMSDADKLADLVHRLEVEARAEALTDHFGVRRGERLQAVREEFREWLDTYRREHR